MELKARLRHALVISRGYTEQLLDTLESPEQWLQRMAPQGNHAIWIAGHLAMVDNAFIGRVDESQVLADFDEWKTLFGRGSTPVDDISVYPAPEILQETLRERRAVLLGLLDAQLEEDFLKPLPPGSPAFMRDRAEMFQMASWHEGLHSGQLSAIHRILGKAPLR